MALAFAHRFTHHYDLPDLSLRFEEGTEDAQGHLHRPKGTPGAGQFGHKDGPPAKATTGQRGGKTTARGAASSGGRATAGHGTATAVDRVQAIPMNRIHVGLNPREHFDREELAALAKNIHDHGLLQPITVRPHEGGYQIIAGERRFRAMQANNATHIPAIVRNVDEGTARELALLENASRSDMRPLETARAYQALIARGKTPAQVAEIAGRSAAHVQQHLTLLTLHPEVQASIDGGHLHSSIVKDLAKLSPARQLEAAKKITEGKGLSVKAARNLIGAMHAHDMQGTLFTPHAPSRTAISAKEDYERRIGQMGEHLSHLNDDRMRTLAPALASPHQEATRLRLMANQFNRLADIADQAGASHESISASERVRLTRYLARARRSRPVLIYQRRLSERGA